MHPRQDRNPPDAVGVPVVVPAGTLREKEADLTLCGSASFDGLDRSEDLELVVLFDVGKTFAEARRHSCS